jgi:hypothetical protein
MSQGAEIVLVVEGVAELLKAAVEAGVEWREQRKLQTADGKAQAVDYVLSDGKVEVGVKVDARTQRAVFVPQDCEAGPGKALAGRVVQRWAYSRVLQDLKSKGYQVAKEEKRRDGSVKLVLQRWR